MPQYHCVKNFKFFLPDSKWSGSLHTFCHPCYCHPCYSPTIAEMIRYVQYKNGCVRLFIIISTRLFLYTVSVQQFKWAIWTIFIKLYSRSRSHFNVVGFTLQFCVCSISSEPFERFIVNFTQMPLSVRRCAEPMNRVCKLKVKVNFQGHGIHPLQFPVRSISPERFWTIFITLHPNVPFGETVCRTHDSAMESRCQCHSSRPWDLPLKLVSATYLQNPLKGFHPNVPLIETVCRSNDSATKSLKGQGHIRGHRIFSTFNLASGYV